MHRPEKEGTAASSAGPHKAPAFGPRQGQRANARRAVVLYLAFQQEEVQEILILKDLPGVLPVPSEVNGKASTAGGAGGAGQRELPAALWHRLEG